MPKDQQEYEVGYGKPPKSGQFAKGNSGNPNGRQSISSEPLIHLMSDGLRGGANLRIPDIPTFRRTLGICRSEKGSV
jgi:hypothetical protein